MALNNAGINQCCCHLWQSPNSYLCPTSSPTRSDPVELSNPSTPNKFRITSWNCRGLSTASPYIQHLAKNNSGLILIQEHWLWPFQLEQLNSLIHGYISTATSDYRLCPMSDLTKGCGGVAILWHNSLKFSSITEICSDSITAVEVELSGSRLSVINVYFTSNGCDEDYQDCLSSLEELQILSAHHSFPILVAGDFNAHLGHLGGPQRFGHPKSTGTSTDMSWLLPPSNQM